MSYMPVWYQQGRSALLLLQSVIGLLLVAGHPWSVALMILGMGVGESLTVVGAPLSLARTLPRRGVIGRARTLASTTGIGPGTTLRLWPRAIPRLTLLLGPSRPPGLGPPLPIGCGLELGCGLGLGPWLRPALALRPPLILRPTRWSRTPRTLALWARGVRVALIVL